MLGDEKKRSMLIPAKKYEIIITRDFLQYVHIVFHKFSILRVKFRVSEQQGRKAGMEGCWYGGAGRSAERLVRKRYFILSLFFRVTYML